MCGITGFYAPPAFRDDRAAEIVRAMTDRLAHRGPDDSGRWIDPAAGIALGHRRLAIVDLSPAGHQPMVSATGRYVLSFNGEIYNHADIRDALNSSHRPAWRGHSDTETLLAQFEQQGVEATLKSTVGMFALALWDRRDRVLTLARDRIGEKPLYYGWQGDSFLFGSELKALRAHPSFHAEVNRDVLLLYLRHGYIPAPYSIYKGIFKVPAGTFLQLGHHDVPGAAPTQSAYWTLREVAEAGLADPFSGSEHEAVSELESLLAQAVSRQRVADVPLGAFLSGGIDSSTIVALMQAQSTTPIRTFTIGFDDPSHNEAEHAQAVAHHLKTEHTEFIARPREALQLLPTLAAQFDEPFGDSSAVPTFMVSRLARQHVTVALSGDGGDELLCGYTRYRRMQRLWSIVNRIPRVGRAAAARIAAATVQLGIGRWVARPNSANLEVPGNERAAQVRAYLTAETMESFYRAQLSQWKNPKTLMHAGVEPPTVLTDPQLQLRRGGLLERMMYADAMSYMPDDVLVKVDRASMAVSLEVRVPMLDHRVVEFAWRLPLHLKVRRDQGKWLLRKVLDKYVPRQLVERPKSGFAVPIGRWLRTELRDWAENLLAPERLKSEGYFIAPVVHEFWQQLRTGNDYLGQSMWQILCFQAWLDGRQAADCNDARHA